MNDITNYYDYGTEPSAVVLSNALGDSTKSSYLLGGETKPLEVRKIRREHSATSGLDDSLRDWADC